MVKHPRPPEEKAKASAQVRHAELWGPREGKDGQGGKYGWLFEHDVQDTPWQEVQPQSPAYLFVPQDMGLRAEYEKGWKVTDIFPVNGVGMTTARDHVVIDFEKEPLLARANAFRNSPDSDEEVCRQLEIPLKKGWNLKSARKLIKVEADLDKLIEPVLYRPFDTRWIFYHDSLVWRTVKQVMVNMLAGDNVALVSVEATIFNARPLLLLDLHYGNQVRGIHDPIMPISALPLC